DFRTKNLSISATKYLYPKNSETEFDYEKFLYVLRKLTTIENIDSKISLSLSGGMDSRVLFALMLQNKTNDWNAHTFGEPEHPDSLIAGKISAAFNVPHSRLFDDEFSSEILIEEIQDYVGQTAVNNPISAVLQLRNYYPLKNKNVFLIDGGFGEIWRSEFFNKIIFAGRKDLTDKNHVKIFKHLKYPHPEIFNKEIKEKMYSGALEAVIQIMETLPSPAELGVEKWLDLFSLNSRLLNLYGPEQTRLDGIAPGYMPFVQLPASNFLFAVNEIEKRNSKLFRRIITNLEPALKKFPLVKGNVSHPFYFGSLQKRIYSKIVGKTKPQKAYPSEILFRKKLDAFIGDILFSLEVKNCSYYDKKKIEALKKDFKQNVETISSDLDWFISFELYRRSVGRKTG
ncbi:MAG: hypothetical protein GXO87_00900, partial [Chlorobi bacterium]|nr:hypothetical protein [Chlorobiota bacterium]